MGTLKWDVSLGRKLRRAVVGSHNTRRLLVGAVLFIAIGVITNLLTPLLTPALLAGQQSWWFRLGMLAVAIIVALVYLQWESRSGPGSPDAIEAQLSQLRSKLRSQVKDRSYGARSKLIEDRLPTLALAITPRVGWVRDPTGTKPEPISERTTDIVAAFESSRGRLLIVGEPGSGKTMAAYSLIEHLNENRGNERKPLLVNLSAWQDQDDFEAFLVDYLCSSVGYEVRERSVANAFISSCKYTLILDGLDEIPSELRTHFPERLYEFARKAPLSDVGVVVTCRTREYEQLLDARPTGLGLVQAVDILPLTSKQLDSAFRELAKFDEDWGAFLSQRHLTASQRARGVLSIPLFLNLAVVGQVSPCQLLKCVNTRELRALVLERYLARTLAEGQRQYASADARRYLTWIARFLKGTEVSPFGLETSDSTVFDLANLTPPEPPSRYRLDSELVSGLVSGLVLGLVLRWPFVVLVLGLVYWLFLVRLGPFYSPEYAAVSTQINLTWPLTRQQRRFFLRELLSPLFLGMFLGLIWGLVWGPFFGALVWGAVIGLGFGLASGPGQKLFRPQYVQNTSRTSKETRSRSLTAALVSGLVCGLFWGTLAGLLLGVPGLRLLLWGPFLGLGLGVVWGLTHGGWFVLLQKIAHRRLARAGKLPPHPDDFLEWGIGEVDRSERQIFRRVGGGVRFRHSLIQQHLANTSEGPRRRRRRRR